MNGVIRMEINLNIREISFAVSIIAVVFMAILFSRNKIPAWKAIVPIYSFYIFAKDVAKAPRLAKKITILSIIVLVASIFFYLLLGIAILHIFSGSPTSRDMSAGIVFMLSTYVVLIMIAAVLAVIWEYKIYSAYNRLYGYDDWVALVGVLFPVIALGVYVLNQKNIVEPNTLEQEQDIME